MSDVGERPPHVLTIVATAVVAWSLFAVLHEVAGHGGAAVMLGEEVRGAVTTTIHISDFYDLERVVARIGWWGFRTVAAAGTAVNLLSGVLALLLLRSRRVNQPNLRYFLWLFGTISIVQQAFWLAVMPFAGLGGDWTAFFIDLEPGIVWKAAVTALGAVLLGLGLRLPLRLWMPALGDGRSERWRRVWRLTAVPVLVAFAVQMLSVLRSPLEGARHTTIVSVLSFLPLFLWLIPVTRMGWPEAGSAPVSGCPGRSGAWLVAGVAAFILFTVVLGQGVGSFVGHPAYRG